MASENLEHGNNIWKPLAYGYDGNDIDPPAPWICCPSSGSPSLSEVRIVLKVKTLLLPTFKELGMGKKLKDNRPLSNLNASSPKSKGPFLSFTGEAEISLSLSLC